MFGDNYDAFKLARQWLGMKSREPQSNLVEEALAERTIVMYVISRRAAQGLLLWQWREDTVFPPCKEGNHEGYKNIPCSGESVRFASPPISSNASYIRSNAWWVEITLRGALPVFPSQADVSTVTERLSNGTRAVFAGYFRRRNIVPSRRNAWASFFMEPFCILLFRLHATIDNSVWTLWRSRAARLIEKSKFAVLIHTFNNLIAKCQQICRFFSNLGHQLHEPSAV